jgi:hypothetical protein
VLCIVCDPANRAALTWPGAQVLQKNPEKNGLLACAIFVRIDWQNMG